MFQSNCNLIRYGIGFLAGKDDVPGRFSGLETEDRPLVIGD